MGFISLASLHPRPSDSNWNYTTGFPRSPACRWHIMELPKVHYYMSQFLIIVRTPQDLFVHIIYWHTWSKRDLVVLFFWRILINTVSKGNCPRPSVETSLEPRFRLWLWYWGREKWTGISDTRTRSLGMRIPNSKLQSCLGVFKRYRETLWINTLTLTELTGCLSSPDITICPTRKGWERQKPSG